MSLHERIAQALGPKWTERDVRSFSLLTIRELLRGKHPKLHDEVTKLIRSGEHILGEGEARNGPRGKTRSSGRPDSKSLQDKG